MNLPFRNRIYYGWVIVASMFLVNFASMATGTLSFGLFVLPMGSALGMSRSTFGWAQTIRTLAAGLSSFVIGRLVDRYGSRVLIVVSAVIIGGCLIGISYANAPWQLLVLFGVIGLTGLTAPNSLVVTVPVAKWFQRSRGRALALATLGLGIGGVTLVPVTQELIDQLEWRWAWRIMAIVFVTIAIPVAALFVRRQPEDMGLTVDGDPVPATLRSEDPGRSNPVTTEAVWTVGEALRTGVMWRLMLVFALAGLAQGGTSIHRVPYWIDEKHFSPQLVSFSISTDAAGAAVMILVAGWVVERVPVRYLGMASYFGFVVAMVFMLLPGENPYYLFSSGIIFGSSVGLGMIMMSYIFADYYGRAFLGAIRGLVFPIILLTSGVGAPLVGFLQDSSGTYIDSWWAVLGLYLSAAVLMVTATPPSRRQLRHQPTEPTP